MDFANMTVKVDTSLLQPWLDKYLPDLVKCAITDCSEKASDHNRIEAALDTVGIGWQPHVRVYLCTKHFEELNHLNSPVKG